MRPLFVPIAALACAGLATYAARGLIEGKEQPIVVEAAPVAAPVVYQKILVAARGLEVGTFVHDGDTAWQEWPDFGVPDGYVVQGEGAFEASGAVVRLPVPAGQPLLPEHLVKPNERGFLAAVLDPGMRAITIPVDEATSNAGLIFPGDRVDLILTRVDNENAGGGVGTRSSRTVLRDLRVLAMGRNIAVLAALDAGAPPVRTVTLEATPDGVQTVALVNELGKLSLSLRSLARDDAARPDLRDGVAEADLLPRKTTRVVERLVVIRGSSKEDTQIKENLP